MVNAINKLKKMFNLSLLVYICAANHGPRHKLSKTNFTYKIEKATYKEKKRYFGHIQTTIQGQTSTLDQ